MGPKRPPPPFEGKSTYKLDYVEKQLPEMPTPAEPPCQPSPRFEGESSYRQEFVEKKVEQEPVAAPSPKPRQPFYDMTSYKHFHDKKTLPQKLGRQRCTAGESVTPRNAESAPAQAHAFEGRSSYKSDFGEKPLPAPHMPAPVRQLQLPFEGESSYRRDFTEKRGRPEPPPEPQAKPQQPFYSETSYRQHFTEKPLPQRPSRGRSAPTGPRGGTQAFEGASTYRSDYTPQPPCVTSPERQPGPAPAPDQRDFATTYGRDFTPRAAAVCPVALMPRCPHYAPSGQDHSFWNEERQRWC